MGHLTKKIKFFFALIYAVFFPIIYKKPRRVVIYYHGVKKYDLDKFGKQMAYLAKNYHVVKASEIKRAKARGRCVVAIMFDDAFASVTENAVPVLKKHGLTATIAVPTGNLGQSPKWYLEPGLSDKNEIVMTQRQIAELDRDGFEVFSHTVSHSVLTQIEDDRLHQELFQSKQALEEIVGHEVVGISYPHGAYDDRVCEAAKAAGYKLGFTIVPRLIHSFTDDLTIGRTSVSPDDNIIKFKLKASGAYQVRKYKKVSKQLIKRFLKVVGYG